MRFKKKNVDKSNHKNRENLEPPPVSFNSPKKKLRSSLDRFVSSISTSLVHRSCLHSDRQPLLRRPKEDHWDLNESFLSTTSRKSVLRRPLSTLLVSPARRTLQRSWSSFRMSLAGGVAPPAVPKVPCSPPPPSWAPTPLPPGLGPGEVRRQQVIQELVAGETRLVGDLQLVLNTHRPGLLPLAPHLCPALFSPLERLLPLHQGLIQRLEKLQQEDGTYPAIGEALVDWIPGLVDSYQHYCGLLVKAKWLLDQEASRLSHFLAQCRTGGRPSLWDLLDQPRSRLARYPLLFSAILRHTPADHADKALLFQALDKMAAVLEASDKETGLATCQHALDMLRFCRPEQHIPALDCAKHLFCSGWLRNSRGTKLQVFLFDTVLVLTRPVYGRNGTVPSSYQVYRSPMPLEFVCAAPHPTDSEVFEVEFRPPTEPPTSLLLRASSHFGRKQWLQHFPPCRSPSV